MTIKQAIDDIRDNIAHPKMIIDIINRLENELTIKKINSNEIDRIIEDSQNHYPIDSTAKFAYQSGAFESFIRYLFKNIIGF